MSSRSDKWHATRRVREAALFADKRFEVVREVKNEEFTTPLGYKGRNGYEVRDIDEPENTFKVGKATLKRMAEEYDAVALPAPKKRGRPKKAQGGVVEGSKDSDEIPFHVDNSFVVKEQENANEPGAHPVSEPNEDDDRSGTLAGPTYTNPNASIVADEYQR